MIGAVSIYMYVCCLYVPMYELRGLSQIIFPTVSVIMTLRGGGGGLGV